MIDRIEASADALWLTPNEDGLMRLGFADDGRELVGPVTHISWLVTSGKVKLGTPFMVVHGEQEDLTLRSPFAGRIHAVNEELAAHPERLNNRNDDLDWMIDLVDE
ncbi:glycine cleavage system H protein (lipoate-binding) [Levilactobacillus angrenensis]|uniref:Glycine cleavage system H protein (Lipoate-binding) n=1 Tax=Levilactobacillus angrenensis TaxID=2486020 RepID=A0ABW1UBE7_9LACO|nr:glycine cleavage system H protein (lipoate-binding) [Levilactobacillus angrenensis]